MKANVNKKNSGQPIILTQEQITFQLILSFNKRISLVL